MRETYVQLNSTIRKMITPTRAGSAPTAAPDRARCADPQPDQQERQEQHVDQPREQHVRPATEEAGEDTMTTPIVVAIAVPRMLTTSDTRAP